ncbi:MAG: nuclear transport factor 2 family protein, partial [Candidatus Atribacteria bacterium]|nr:nuclear transport factor 2 family protein [Candidatus Atribacteria bacterium]
MSKEELISMMRKFKDAYNKKDLEKSLSFFAEDADWVNPNGVFKGKEEIKNYFKWVFEVNTDQKIIESGIKIIAEEDKAVYEHILEGSFEGMKYKILALCIYEFKGDKFQHLRTTYDRLSMAKQLAKGPIAKTAVNT